MIEAEAPLSESFKVVVYDRRGHSRSERPAGPGSVYDDADDLAALIEALELGPAHVVGNSFGSIVALNAAIRHPAVFATLVAHEPPLLGMLAETRFEPVLEELNRRVGAVIELLAAGEDEAGAKLFVETVAWRPGAWEGELTAEMRTVFTGNAPTFLDEAHDPDWQQIDLDQLARFSRPALLTKGTTSPPFFVAIVDSAVHRSCQALRRGRSRCLAGFWWWRRVERAVTCNRGSPPPGARDRDMKWGSSAMRVWPARGVARGRYRSA